MTMMSIQPIRRMITLAALASLAVLTIVLSACGGGASTTTTTTTSSASASTTSSAPAGGSVVTITIAEKTGGHDIYSFDPPTVTIKAGTTVKWVNNSDENHLLACSTSGIFTASSKVPRSGSDNNTYQMTFQTAGTYNYTSTLVQRLNNQPEGASSSATGTITVTN